MTHRIPAWIAIAASGVLAAASAFAQAGGDNPKPAGDGSNSTAQAQAGSPAATKARPMRHAAGKHAKARHARLHRHTDTTTSSAGTEAARGDRGLDADMNRCASMTDRQARADCASRAWERRHGTTG